VLGLSTNLAVITIKCSTRFDITATGVTGHYKSARQPFLSELEWNRARNQQRNWETLQQLISLRTQIIGLTAPVQKDSQWHFEFSSETPDVFGDARDPVAILKHDAQDVPMLLGLDNDPDIEPVLIAQGKNQNIWFSVFAINS
jgi:hypothetical protein